MVPLGPPPADFGRRRLPLVVLRAEERLLRIHRADRNAVHFSRGADNRFDDPSIPHRYGVLYAATSTEAAFSEVFGRGPAPVVLSEVDLRSRELAGLVLRRRVKLADMTGPSARKAGATGEISTCAYGISRLWGAAIHGHPDKVNGILYVGRHDNSTLSVALFDRARPALGRIVDLGTLASDEVRLAALLDRYGFGLD